MKRIMYITLIAAILVLATVLVACNSPLLKGTKLSCDNGVIKIDNPQVGATYRAIVNGIEQEIGDNYEIVIPDNTKDGVDVEVKVYDDKGSEVGSISKTFDVIPTVKVYTVDGRYDWSASDAEIKAQYSDKQVQYVVSLNNVLSTTNESSIVVPAGINTIRVRPYIVGSTDSYGCFSEPVSCNILAAPQNMVIDGSIVTWSPVSFASMSTNYEVKINDLDPVTVHSNYINLEREFPALFADAALRADIQVSVRAVADSEAYDSSAYSTPMRFASLDPVSNLRFEGTLAVWDENPYADSYILIVNDGSAERNKEVVVEGESQYQLQIFADRNISVKVRPNVQGAMVDTSWSKEINATFLPTPTLYYENGMFYWNAVSNAHGYRVVVEALDGNKNLIEGGKRVIDLEQDTLSLAYNFDKGGFYRVYMYCLAVSSPTYVDSEASNVINVSKLTAPKNFKLQEKMTDLDFSIQSSGAYLMSVEFERIAGNSSYYQLLLDGTTIFTGTTKHYFDFILPSNVSGDDYVLEVRAMSFDDTKPVNDTLTLSANGSLKINLHKLAVPTELSVANNDNVLTWTANDERAEGYSIFTGATIESRWGKDAIAFGLGSITPGTYNLRVSARGNMRDNEVSSYTADPAKKTVGNTEVVDLDNYVADVVASSDFSNLCYITKLNTPDNVQVRSNGATLGWDSVEGAEGYYVNVNVTTEPASEGKDAVVETFQLVAARRNSQTDEIEAYSNVIPAAAVNFRDLFTVKDGVYKEFSMTTHGNVFNIVAVGNHGVEVQNGQAITVDSNASNTETFFKLRSPTGLRVSGSQLTWTAPDPAGNVRSYSVFDNGYLISDGVTGTNYSIAALEAGKHCFSVVANGDNINYFVSDAATLVHGQMDEVRGMNYVIKLSDMSAIIERVGASYRWQAQEGAALYAIQVSAGTSPTQYEAYNSEADEDGYVYFTPNFGGYTNPGISFIAKGDDQLYVDSAEYSFIQYTKVFDTPRVEEGKYLVDIRMVNGLVCLATDAVDQGNGFVFYVDQIAHYSEKSEGSGASANVCVLPYTMTGSHTVRIAARGNYFVREEYENPLTHEKFVYDYYCYESEKNTFVYTFNCLPSVARNSITVSQKSGTTWTIKWASIEGAQYYVYYKVYANAADAEADKYIGDGFGGATVTTSSIDLTDELFVKNSGKILRVFVLAKGNGADVFSSSVFTYYDHIM